MEDVQRQGEPDLAIRVGETRRWCAIQNDVMGLTHVVVGRQQDLQRIEGPEALPNFRLLDVRAHAVGWNNRWHDMWACWTGRP